MKIAPSILTADFRKLEQEIQSINEADLIHIDIMDGNFVPNISFGPAITKQINDISTVLLDVHLMVLDPLKWIDEFSLSNVEYITVHYEANNYKEAMNKIKANNKKVGLSIKPETNVSEIIDELKNVDLLLVMSVEPGFGGQKLIKSSLDKIRELVRLRDELNLNFLIEIDGGVNKDTIDEVRDTEVDIAVVGSYLFNQNNRNEIMKKLRWES